MDEQHVTASTDSSKKTVPIIIAVVVLLGAGWFFTRGMGGIAGLPTGLDVDRNMDGSATYSNDEGSVTVGANSYPDNWPGDAPKYGNGQVQYSASSNQQTGENGSMLVLVTSDGTQKVIDFYKSELASKGWTIEQTATVGQMTMVSATKGTATFAVQVVNADGQTTVTIGISNN